ncbi:MAG: hypothetical protein VYE22_02005 [Myxococcota bacterium]|nr:hypothetical protein [Myxococcota bacterium]
MSDLRFELGAAVMCNLGPSGWKLGRIIALHYREGDWPAGTVAPYQVALEEDHALIYVPEDDARYCREPTPEDLRIARRADALAAPPVDLEVTQGESDSQLGCEAVAAEPGSPGYRSGRCHCCQRCPRSWSCAELYSEHYRCAARNGLRVTRRAVDLGVVRVGDSLAHPASAGSRGGFMQAPTLVRLPPGVRFFDDGSLAGEVRFDPHRAARYQVELVAASTAEWDDAAVGIVRLEITFVVEGNEPPDDFDVDAFVRGERRARAEADRTLGDLFDAWERWERGALSNRDTCDRMGADLRRLRALLERHPRLDGGRWWAWLGGLHMNVHKLLENTLFECELSLGHALTFGDAEVRRLAEQNLEGCYQKRLLEAARFMWIEGSEKMARGERAAAADTLRLAAAKKDGWGWAVNYGDIWIAESVARLAHGAELDARGGDEEGEGSRWIAEAAVLLERGAARADEARVFGAEGHPWAAEIGAALVAYRGLRSSGADTTEWLEALKLRTDYWCAQVLGGAPPFPPRPRPRLEDAAALVRRLPGHNE